MTVFFFIISGSPPKRVISFIEPEETNGHNIQLIQLDIYLIIPLSEFTKADKEKTFSLGVLEEYVES